MLSSKEENRRTYVALLILQALKSGLLGETMQDVELLTEQESRLFRQDVVECWGGGGCRGMRRKGGWVGIILGQSVWARIDIKWDRFGFDFMMNYDDLLYICGNGMRRRSSGDGYLRNGNTPPPHPPWILPLIVFSCPVSTELRIFLIWWQVSYGGWWKVETWLGVVWLLGWGGG
jgi:hypothetical protein